MRKGQRDYYLKEYLDIMYINQKKFQHCARATHILILKQSRTSRGQIDSYYSSIYQVGYQQASDTTNQLAKLPSNQLTSDRTKEKKEIPKSIIPSGKRSKKKWQSATKSFLGWRE